MSNKRTEELDATGKQHKTIGESFRFYFISLGKCRTKPKWGVSIFSNVLMPPTERKRIL